MDDTVYTEDLELLLAILKNSIQCLKFSIDKYCHCQNDFEKTISSHFTLLKELVIDVMTDGEFHPEHTSIFNEKNKSTLEICRNNLEGFDRIFLIFRQACVTKDRAVV